MVRDKLITVFFAVALAFLMLAGCAQTDYSMKGMPQKPVKKQQGDVIMSYYNVTSDKSDTKPNKAFDNAVQKRETSQQEVKRVVFETTLGNIELELYPSSAPITVSNFLSYVESGFYDGLVFHRVIDGFMIQGGGFTVNGTQRQTREPIILESNNSLKNLRGTIAMARTSMPDSATSQFFINVADNSFLDYGPGNPGYAVFGKVVSGMDVVDKISKVKTETRYGIYENWPVDDVVILKARIKKE